MPGQPPVEVVSWSGACVTGAVAVVFAPTTAPPTTTVRPFVRLLFGGRGAAQVDVDAIVGGQVSLSGDSVDVQVGLDDNSMRFDLTATVGKRLARLVVWLRFGSPPPVLGTAHGGHESGNFPLETREHFFGLFSGGAHSLFFTFELGGFGLNEGGDGLFPLSPHRFAPVGFVGLGF